MVRDITFENCLKFTKLVVRIWSISAVLCLMTLVGLLIASIILFSYMRFKNYLFTIPILFAILTKKQIQIKITCCMKYFVRVFCFIKNIFLLRMVVWDHWVVYIRHLLYLFFLTKFQWREIQYHFSSVITRLIDVNCKLKHYCLYHAHLIDAVVCCNTIACSNTKCKVRARRSLKLLKFFLRLLVFRCKIVKHFECSLSEKLKFFK